MNATNADFPIRNNWSSANGHDDDDDDDDVTQQYSYHGYEAATEGAVSDQAEYKAAMLLWTVWPPCILVLGGFGNVATIFVMRRMRDGGSGGGSSQPVLLMALAVCDLFFLYIGALRIWLKYYLGVDVYTWHEAMCKLYAWLIYSSNSSSAWLLVFVTGQRTMAVTWPHKVRTACTVRRTWTAVAAVIVTALLFHCHWLVGMRYSSDGMCDYISSGYLQFVLIWSWVDMCLSSLLPSFCLLVCDVVLSWSLFKASTASSLTLQAAVSDNAGAGSGSGSGSGAAKQGDRRRRTASRTTVMILVLSSTFLFLTLPVCVYILWRDFVDVAESPRQQARAQLAKAVTFLLWYTNSAVNFLLYCFTGTKFRREFLSWVCCQARHGHSVPYGGDKTSDVSGRK